MEQRVIRIGQCYINKHGNLCLKIESKSYLRIDRILKTPRFTLLAGKRVLTDYAL